MKEDERRRGDWPTWLMAVGCGVAFVAGVFVSWAVFAESGTAGSAAGTTETLSIAERIKAVESANANLQTRVIALEKANEKSKSVIETQLITANMLTLLDENGNDRVGISTLLQ